MLCLSMRSSCCCSKNYQGPWASEADEWISPARAQNLVWIRPSTLYPQVEYFGNGSLLAAFPQNSRVDVKLLSLSGNLLVSPKHACKCLPSCLCRGWGLTVQPGAPPTCSALPSPRLPPAHPPRLTGQNGYTVDNLSSYLSVSLCINSPLTLSLHPPRELYFCLCSLSM